MASISLNAHYVLGDLDSGHAGLLLLLEGKMGALGVRSPALKVLALAFTRSQTVTAQ